MYYVLIGCHERSRQRLSRPRVPHQPSVTSELRARLFLPPIFSIIRGFGESTDMYLVRSSCVKRTWPALQSRTPGQFLCRSSSHLHKTQHQPEILPPRPRMSSIGGPVINRGPSACSSTNTTHGPRDRSMLKGPRLSTRTLCALGEIPISNAVKVGVGAVKRVRSTMERFYTQ